MSNKVRVYVTLKEGVFDPQGEAIRRAVGRLGYQGVQGVRTGRLIELDLAESSLAESSGGASDGAVDIDSICKELLANEVIENYHIEAKDRTD